MKYNAEQIGKVLQQVTKNKATTKTLLIVPLFITFGALSSEATFPDNESVNTHFLVIVTLMI